MNSTGNRLEYEELSQKADEEGKKFDIDDVLTVGKNYFSCGFHRTESYYNHKFSVAVSIIGRLCGTEQGSDYRRGIAYIAKELHISKRQVKSLRKNMKCKGGYIFKIPMSIPAILEKMIAVFVEENANSLIQTFLTAENDKGVSMYRTIFIEKHYDVIKNASSKSEELNGVADNILTELNSFTQKFN